jgi:hypothetical protein
MVMVFQVGDRSPVIKNGGDRVLRLEEGEEEVSLPLIEE